jgi:hypothetical protein
MTCYVDALRPARVPRTRSKYWCHLMADTEDELHAMAESIGMRRSWYQGDHYDLTSERRILAVKKGAVEVTSRDLAKIRRERKQNSTPKED